MPVIGGVVPTRITGSMALGSLIGISGSLHINYDGVSSDSGADQDGYIQMFDMTAAPSNPTRRDQAKLYVSASSETSRLYFRDSAGTETQLGAGGDNRYTVSARFKTYFSAKNWAHFTDFADASGDQFRFSTSTGIRQSWSGFVGADIELPYQYFMVYGGARWLAPRDCELSKITGNIYAAAAKTGTQIRAHILKGTPGQDVQHTTDTTFNQCGDILWTLVTNETAGICYTSTVTTGSGVTISAGDGVVIAISAEQDYFSSGYMTLTCEFTEL